MSASDADAASFLTKLGQAYPEFRIVGPLLLRRAPALLAFEAIAHELAQATFHLPEPSVAASKLQWWRDEIERHMAGEARHPLTRSLDVVPAARFDPTLFDALIDMAMQGRDAAPARDFDAQRRAVAPVFTAIEQLRVAVLGTAGAAVGIQADIAVATHLLRELARLPFAEDVPASVVPMQLLARHQSNRSELATPGSTRDAIVRAQAADIGAWLTELGPAVTGAAAWLARVRWRCECWRARPLGGADPFAVLWPRLERAPWNTAWTAWRAQRRAP
ncbi:MAG: hypothetical protein AMXMBFR59_27690 [Rhodanobacteraceae bacterium]